MKKTVNKLKDLVAKHDNLLKNIISADECNFYYKDWIVLLAVDKALKLSRGFISEINAKNHTVCMILLRTQIDLLLRMFALGLVRDSEGLAKKMLYDNERLLEKTKDIYGRFLTNNYILKIFSNEFNTDILKKMYKKTSGFIHFSNDSINHIIKCIDNEKQELDFIVSEIDSNISEEVYINCVDCFIKVTKYFFLILEGWLFTKTNPKESQKIKKYHKEIKTNRNNNKRKNRKRKNLRKKK